MVDKPIMKIENKTCCLILAASLTNSHYARAVKKPYLFLNGS